MTTTATWSFEAIGTWWQIALYDDIDNIELNSVKKTVAKRIERFDKTYSRFRADSLVTQIAHTVGNYRFPPDVIALVKLYTALYAATEGAMTPLIGRTLADAGYDAAYSLQPKLLQKPVGWDEALEWQGATLTTSQPVLLDFGAAGKGYLVDLVARELEQCGIRKFHIDAGGDIVARGVPGGLKVGLEHPADPDQVIGVLTLQGGAICGSAGNRRQWAGYTHILDPHTLRSPRHIAATWCSAADALTADGLATALYFASPAALREQFDFEYCLVHADGTAEYSEGFRPALFQPQPAGVAV